MLLSHQEVICIDIITHVMIKLKVYTLKMIETFLQLVSNAGESKIMKSTSFVHEQFHATTVIKTRYCQIHNLFLANRQGNNLKEKCSCSICNQMGKQTKFLYFNCKITSCNVDSFSSICLHQSFYLYNRFIDIFNQQF